MSASLSGVWNAQEFTDLGALAANYRLYTYSPGTTTQKVAYTDAAASVAHTYTNDGNGGQYIPLNARGELPAPLFLTSGGYDLTLKTDAGVTVWTRRAYGQTDAGDTLRADLASTADATKGAFQIGKGFPVVDSITALRACLKTSTANRVFVSGYYAAGDGGGGPYYYDSSDTTSADNGGTIIVASDGGRWKLVHDGTFSVDQFGAKGDGVTDDASAFSAAHAAAVTAGAMVTLDPAKTYVLGSTITATGAFRFRGRSHGTRGGTNTPFTGLTGPVIKWTGADASSVMVVDQYTSEHTELSGINFDLPSTYAGKAVTIKGGPYLTQGGVGSVFVEHLGFYRRGSVSPQATNAIGVYVDCTGSLADGRVGSGWVLRHLFGFNILSVLEVEVANNTLGTVGLDNWWNSNLVEDVYGYQVYQLINLIGGTTNGNAIWRNIFRGCTNQPGLGLTSTYATGACVNASGQTQYNSFDHCTAWDLTSGSEFNLPETNIRRGYFGDYFSHTEGIEMYGATAAEFLKMRRPGWSNAYRVRSQYNDGARFMLSNNWDGNALDDAGMPGAAVVLHTEAGIAAIRMLVGAGLTEMVTVQDGLVLIHNLPTAAPATSGALWRDAAAGNVLKVVP